MSGFQAMAEAWRDRIYSFAYYSLGSREEAEDVTQEVLVRLWQHWPTLSDGHTVPWLIRVARNACLDVHRRRQTRTAFAANHSDDCPVNPSPVADDPDAILERQEFRKQVETALHEIEEPYRSIVILREIETLSYAEIADALALPLNTVKVYLHRGRRRLRELLKEEYAHGTL
ncbi:MAG: sigma-70 family RNA polymerase sigma factor [Candidatus Zixiibacteriota bacterium]